MKEDITKVNPDASKQFLLFTRTKNYVLQSENSNTNELWISSLQAAVNY